MCSVRKCALPGRNFVRKEFCQAALKRAARKDRKEFVLPSRLCQEGILPVCHKKEVCHARKALSGRNSVKKEFCQEGINSARTRDGKRQCALPGRGSKLWKGGESALELCVMLSSCEGNGGESALELCVSSPSSAGNGGESASGGRGGNDVSQLWSCVCCCCRLLSFFGGGGGRVSFQGCEGGRGASQLWIAGDGGESASGGNDVSQLWSCVCCCCCLLSFFGGVGGESASGGAKGE